MTIEQAIEKSKECGAPWDPWNVQQPHKLFVTPEEVFISPIFWQSLGKALGWNDFSEYGHMVLVWKVQWHRFIDHLAEGGTSESFFKDL